MPGLAKGGGGGFPALTLGGALTGVGLFMGDGILALTGGTTAFGVAIIVGGGITFFGPDIGGATLFPP